MSGLDGVEAYPLTWPAMRTRTPPGKRERSRFGSMWTVHSATKAVIREHDLMRGRGLVVSTNMPLRRDGLPYSNQRQPEDPGAAVYFLLDKDPHVLACDRWDRVEHNLRAIARHMDALRGLERWGVGSLREAFAGYRALPEQAGPSSGAHWTQVLGFQDGERVTREAVRVAARHLAKVHHPDKGGSNAAMSAVNRAVQQALEEVAP